MIAKHRKGDSEKLRLVGDASLFRNLVYFSYFFDKFSYFRILCHTLFEFAFFVQRTSL